MWYLYAGYAAATLLFSVAHIATTRRERNSERIWAIVLAYAIFFNVGVASLVAFYAHAFRPVETAALIGWPAGNPFQFEVACANLSFGVLGVLCLWLGAKFRLATILGFSVFVLGAAVGHIQQITLAGNQAPGNAGAPLYADIMVPMALMILWAVQYVIARRAHDRKLLAKCI
jgi:hypothetical protein